MTNQKDPKICPHCGEKMATWQMPPTTDWGDVLKYVCFNNDCPYYVKGWEHTKKTMNKPASYRHSYNPERDQVAPMPVWSEDACREFIVPEKKED